MEAGAIRPNDLNAVKVVVRALDTVGVYTARQFSTLVNKVDQRLYKNKMHRNEVARRISSTFSHNDIFVSPENIAFVTSKKRSLNPTFLDCESWTLFIRAAPTLSVNRQGFTSAPLQPHLTSSATKAREPSQERPQAYCTLFHANDSSSLTSHSSIQGDLPPAYRTTQQLF